MSARPRVARRLSAVLLGLALAGPARAQVTATGATLVWTAPGDDSLSGTAARYDLRFSTTPIVSLADFALAFPVQGMAAPRPPGGAETVTVNGLTPETGYWFALRTFDEVGNGSALSNVVQFVTLASADVIRPAPIGLALIAASNSSVTLGWNDVGDDSLTGTATAVEVRWSTAPITEANWFAATDTGGEPVPGPPDTPQQLVATGLDRSQDLWFAARARDDVNRLSGITSTLLVPHLLDTAPPGTPAGLGATLETGRVVHLRWDANPEPDVAGYFVYRALDAAGPFARLTASPSAPNDYADGTAPDTLAAWYQVSAVDGSGNESARTAAVRVYLRGGGITAWSLATPYPNPSPVNGPVTLPLEIPAAGPYDAIVDIQDAAGQHVRTLRVAGAAPGAYSLVWDGRNDAGRACAPGVYRAWLRVGKQPQLVRFARTP